MRRRLFSKGPPGPVILLATAGALLQLGFARSQGRPAPTIPSAPSAAVTPAAAITPGAVPGAAADRAAIDQWCSEVKSAAQDLKWKVEPCFFPEDWKVGGRSVEGRPLIYASYGEKSSSNTTLIFSTIHGDEVTPLYLGVQIAKWLKEHEGDLKGKRVVIAPLVNPDGFFRKPRTRMNARGVDVNRNFLTSDWSAKALQTWKKKYRSDPRRFPGHTPRSEPETLFQEELIAQVKPQKILAIHSPLNHLDYDGPTALSLARFPREYVRECIDLRKRLKAVSTGFFPGSLGNYAGQELGIPTVTLELPSADPSQAHRYWMSFSKGIQTMIDHNVSNYALGTVTQPGS